MSKALIILCISLGALVAVGSAQENSDDANVLDDLAYEETEETPIATGAESKPISLAILPTMDRIDSGIRKTVEKREIEIASKIMDTMSEAKRIMKNINDTLKFWQSEHQELVMNFGTMKREKYETETAKYPGKDFSKCEKTFNRLEALGNKIGNGFFECHYYYEKHLLYLARKIHASAQPELAVLQNVKETDCKISSANDDASKAEALKCLINIMIDFYNRPRTENLFFYYIERLKEMGENQIQGYAHFCPAIYQWEVFNHLQVSWYSSLDKCVRNVAKS